MAEINKLAATFVTKVKTPGMYSDGGGLYLQVTPSGARTWIYRFQLNKRPREMGLGPAHSIGLAEARVRRDAARKLKVDGVDPIEAKREAAERERLELAKAITFKAAAERYISAHKASWKNAKHAAQWTATLEAYAYPTFGELPVGAVDTGLVLKAIEGIWSTKPETASRVRGRVESILDWARVRGYREGENPARWRGHLDKLLPARSRVRQVAHHAALPYVELGDFMAALRVREGLSARALEFAILTAGRTGEVLGARWAELDLGAKVWTIPADRMKAKREHRVPLSQPAIDLLTTLQAEQRREAAEVHDRLQQEKDGAAGGEDTGADQEPIGAFVFPGAANKAARPDLAKPLSNMALLETLRRMGRGDLTAHGFRSTFRDWAPSAPARPARWWKWPWRTPSPTRSRRLIGAAISSKSVGG